MQWHLYGGGAVVTLAFQNCGHLGWLSAFHTIKYRGTADCVVYNL